LAAAGVVAVALALAAVAVVIIMRSALTGRVNAAVMQRASDVAAVVATGDDARLGQLVRPAPGEETVAQVLDAAGMVVSASPDLEGEPPLSPLRPAAGQTLWQQRPLPVDQEEPFRIVAMGVDSPHGPRVVLVGGSLRPVQDSTRVLTTVVSIGFPSLVLVVGAATFVFVGRSLRPVKAIRQRVASITGHDVRARVPVPATGDEVAALAETMNGMLDRLAAATAAQRRFVADASHEMRSPLASIQAGLDILSTDPVLPETGQQQVGRLRAESERLSRLVDDLLLLARVDEQGLALRHDDVDLDDLAYAERERLATHHPALRVRMDVHPVRVTGDAHHLTRALRNLVDNAARHANTTVTIRVWAEPAGIYVEVGDDGPGIPAADRERVFDRFVRLDDSRSRTDGGTGLGLPIAREIVAAHGGTTTVVDTDAGAVLRIALPARQPGATRE
jgi:signal transduction histidine kinase